MGERGAMGPTRVDLTRSNMPLPLSHILFGAEEDPPSLIDSFNPVKQCRAGLIEWHNIFGSGFHSLEWAWFHIGNHQKHNNDHGLDSFFFLNCTQESSSV